MGNGIIIILIIGVVLIFTFNIWYPMLTSGSVDANSPPVSGGEPVVGDTSDKTKIITAISGDFPAYIADPTAKGGQKGVLTNTNGETQDYVASEYQQGWVSTDTAAGMAIVAEEKALADLKTKTTTPATEVQKAPQPPSPPFSGGSTGGSGASGSW